MKDKEYAKYYNSLLNFKKVFERNNNNLSIMRNMLLIDEFIFIYNYTYYKFIQI